ncbi:MAG: homocysteine S-methyltransferase family protein [Candidatus Nanopelagicales bacterium]|jgi:5-methyltetrahydrofolate--homocysteine methyltransferase|nr:homocysteine S-methyltransferase family protein [Candidatus Nanopelagicales bacterium]MDP4714362.1 homocysteine S-methyltransferase family protein [Candidatus Nanopelagicales bacterium]MDP4905703.1 homocysteine S-methyltransferase family protein [Candidatus Nanopelagicales bacterium]
MSNLLDALNDGPLLGDGAMGTMLQDLGNSEGGAPELWNVERADVVEAVLEGYAAAGSRLLTTNTFGGTRARLQMHDLEARVGELNQAAAELARRVADRYDGVFVLGDIGPSGELMEPMGELTPESAADMFGEQIRGLVAGGVDGILIETMSDLAEVEAAVTAARAEAPGLPVLVTLSFDTNLRTMMGVSPTMAVQSIAEMGADVIGANCGRGLDEMRIIAAQLAESGAGSVRLMVQSNAGLPRLQGDTFIFDGTPDEMATYAADMRDLGFSVIGACCGSTPEHIAAMRAALT